MPDDVLQGEVIATYRTVPAQVLGWAMVAGAAALAALTIVDVSRGQRAGLVGASALVVGLAAVAWVLFLRPRVRLHSDGLELANIVTDTVVPFGAVEEITHQWALEVHDRDGTRHSAWAVPVKRERVRRTEVDDFGDTTRQRGTGGTTAQVVADEVQRALQRWRLDGGQVRGTGADTVTRRRSWPAVGVLAGAMLLALLAIVL